MLPIRLQDFGSERDGSHVTIGQASGMRYQLQITTSGGPLPTTILHVVVFTEPHDSEPLCGTNPRSP
jgi:hypothetical protein